MRLFHVSEESDIKIFEPRLPARKDLDPTVGLVWALDERHLPNFLTPRDCPRVTYNVSETTLPEDLRWFSSPTQRHCVVIEKGWFEKMRKTTLYIYEFDPADFELQDAAAGYYVAKKAQIPVGVRRIDDLFMALLERNVEIRVVDYLWDICRQVQKSSLEWSMCRMRNAIPEK